MKDKVPNSPIITFSGNVEHFDKLTIDVRDVSVLALHNHPAQIGNFNIVMKGGTQSYRILRQNIGNSEDHQQKCIDVALKLYVKVVSVWKYYVVK